jgi:hypothetical protein
VLILPSGHAETLHASYRISRREKWILASVLAVVAAIVAAVVISLGTAERHTGNGCVDVKFPTTIGAAEIYQCGARARALCGSVGTPGGVSSVEEQAVAEQCRKAGLPVG